MDNIQNSKQEAQKVAGTALEEGGAVIEEGLSHARALLDEGLNHVKGQAADGHTKVGEVVRGLANDVDSLLKGEQPAEGLTTQVLGNVQQLTDRAASYVESTKPEDLVRDVRRFAARKPGLFMGVAFGLGLLGGRVIRGLQPEEKQELEYRAPVAPVQPAVQPVEPQVTFAEPVGYGDPVAYGENQGR